MFFFSLSAHVSLVSHIASTTLGGFLALLRLFSTLPDPAPRLPSLGYGPQHDATVSRGRRYLLQAVVVGFSLPSPAFSRLHTHIYYYFVRSQTLFPLHRYIYSRPPVFSPVLVPASTPVPVLVPAPAPVSVLAPIPTLVRAVQRLGREGIQGFRPWGDHQNSSFRG